MRRLALVAILGLVAVSSPPAAWSQERMQSTRSPFRVTWAPMIEGPPPVIQGHVYNDSSLRVTNVRLEIDAVDDAGRAVGRTFGWALGDIVPGGETAFFVEAIPGAVNYHIRVHSFDVVAGSADPQREGRTP